MKKHQKPKGYQPQYQPQLRITIELFSYKEMKRYLKRWRKCEISHEELDVELRKIAHQKIDELDFSEEIGSVFITLLGGFGDPETPGYLIPDGELLIRTASKN